MPRYAVPSDDEEGWNSFHPSNKAIPAQDKDGNFVEDSDRDSNFSSVISSGPKRPLISLVNKDPYASSQLWIQRISVGKDFRQRNTKLDNNLDNIRAKSPGRRLFKNEENPYDTLSVLFNELNYSYKSRFTESAKEL